MRGDTDDNGVSLEAGRIDLNGGTIQDGVNNDAVLDHEELAADSSHKVDVVKPELASAAAAVVVDGATLTLTYNELLDRSSTPETEDFTVRVESTERSVTNVAVNGSAVELTLDPAAEHEETGITVSYTPWTNPLRDAVGNDAEGLSYESVTNETPDTAAPTVSSVEITSTPPDNRDTYALGEAIEVTATFDETVVVTRTPLLTLNVGGGDRTANYQSGTGAALVFAYEVAEGDEDTGGVSIDANRLSLNGGAIQDGADNDCGTGP